jgi:hypothetical protein
MRAYNVNGTQQATAAERSTPEASRDSRST